MMTGHAVTQSRSLTKISILANKFMVRPANPPLTTVVPKNRSRLAVKKSVHINKGSAKEIASPSAKRVLALTLILDDRATLRNFPCFADDFDFVKAVVRANGLSFADASLTFRNSAEMALFAIKAHGDAFTCVSAELRADSEFVLQALHANPYILDTVSTHFLRDVDFLLKALSAMKSYPFSCPLTCMKHLLYELYDREIFLTADSLLILARRLEDRLNAIDAKHMFEAATAMITFFASADLLHNIANLSELDSILPLSQLICKFSDNPHDALSHPVSGIPKEIVENIIADRNYLASLRYPIKPAKRC